MKNVAAVKSGLFVTVMRRCRVRRGFVCWARFPNEAAAWKAAQAMREKFIREMGPGSKEEGAYRKCNSNTGHTGVTESANHTGRDRPPFITVAVRPAPGMVRSKKFYFVAGDKAGRERAIDEAVAWREAILEERRKRIKR